MSPSVFEVVRLGRKWGVSADGEVLALSTSRRGAEDLARKAEEALEAGDEQARQRRFVRPEPRSFADD
jgi:hypothetical protein